jgi:metal-sulfur cluster biosynthetic enzyme
MSEEVQCEFPPGYDASVLWERLGHVLDPELDEPILQLRFIRSLTIHDGHATIAIRLPTSWCAANFAYMMAEDIRHALLTTAGIHQVTVRLGDHFAAAAIEAAVNAGSPFPEAFPGEGCGSLAPLRALFLQKGLTSRQARLLRELRAAGLPPQAMCALRVGDLIVQEAVYLVRQGGHAPIQIGPADTLRDYLARRGELGLSCVPSALLLTDLQGQPLTMEGFETYYHAARTVRVALEANGSFCRAVLAGRQSTLLTIDTLEGATGVHPQWP